ncbi:MAG: hypothetical protein HRU15_14080 [Planctomycetes bacterium]|nr:hypothetical protein [Planctomycetota bacterium]
MEGKSGVWSFSYVDGILQCMQESKPRSVGSEKDRGIICADFDGDLQPDFLTKYKKHLYMTMGGSDNHGAICPLKERYTSNIIANDFNNDGLVDFLFLESKTSKKVGGKLFIVMRKTAESNE